MANWTPVKYNIYQNHLLCYMSTGNKWRRGLVGKEGTASGKLDFGRADITEKCHWIPVVAQRQQLVARLQAGTYPAWPMRSRVDIWSRCGFDAS